MFSAPEITFQHKIVGTWGEFNTPAGRVSYLMTKARLGGAGSDYERRLTSQLCPVREVLPPETLDFNQLLQRDLDDHRVATELLPYLLMPKPTGPAFFPPIVTVLLPFSGHRPEARFPEPQDLGEVKRDGVDYLENRFGTAFRVQRLSVQGKLHNEIKLGRVDWNEEFAKLVVLDGQHRAMALIAVDRTINKTWQHTGGERYKHFYEHRVETLLKEAKAKGQSIDLDSIEVPVAVCWFPEAHGQGLNAHKAARKLFVDVNKEARKPSEARLTLLSDSELLNVFTRRLLNRLREEAPPLPLYAIEYDNPEREAARPIRWSVLTNISLLKYAVQYTLFGPDKYIEDLSRRMSGRPSWKDMNARMQGQLELDKILPSVITDGDREMERGSITNDDFPLSQVQTITDQFMRSWGEAILHLLGQLRPYEAHCKALTDLYTEWSDGATQARLAKDALFIGVGMYWTLKNSDEHWREKVQRQRDEAKDRDVAYKAPPKPEIVKAWEILAVCPTDPENKSHDPNSKFIEFVTKRAYYYTDTQNPGQMVVADCQTLYDTLNTHACQLGLMLAFASLCHHHHIQGAQLTECAARCVEAWNRALTSKVNKSRDRLFALGRSDISTNKHPINRIGKMDTPMAVYFRYFWLELLYLPEAFEAASHLLDRTTLRTMLWPARKTYLQYLIKEQTKALKSTHPTWKAPELATRAEEIEHDELRKGLKWFGLIDADEWDLWLAFWEGHDPASADAAETPDDADDSEDEPDEDRAFEAQDMQERDEVIYDPSVLEILDQFEDSDEAF